MTYRLYAYWRSSASWRVRIALNYKKVPYEITPVHIVENEQKQEAYRGVNPMAQVPTLEWTDTSGKARRIGQSLAIMEHLDEQHPSVPLLSRDPFLRARGRQIAEIVNSGIQPFQNLATLAEVRALGGDDKQWIRRFIGEGLAAIEQLARETSGRYLVGDEPSFADVCVVPQLATARRFELVVDAFPTLLRAENECRKLDAFVKAEPERQPDAPKA